MIQNECQKTFDEKRMNEIDVFENNLSVVFCFLPDLTLRCGKYCVERRRLLTIVAVLSLK